MLEPLSTNQWDAEKAAHLLNRVGFGGSPREVDRFTSLGLEAAVGELVDYEQKPTLPLDGDWTMPDLVLQEQIAGARNSGNPDQIEVVRKETVKKYLAQTLEMRQAWLNLMRNGLRPFEEKMTLFWHGHFATSIVKVRDPYFMWLQNEVFRSNATGSWVQMLTQVAKDPAMLIWLDGAESRKGNPNENFAREVMELFTLGEGYYSEDDIRNAARAFVGWTVNRKRQEFRDLPRQHDESMKEFLGKSGSFSGEDILRILATSDRSGEYLMGRLWLYFCNDEPPVETVKAMAKQFASSGQTFKPVLRELFLSRDFYQPEIVRHQVKSPVQWLISTCKYLEIALPHPVLCNQILRQLGQELFAPPSVKGWDGGVSWITTNSLFSRYNFAGLLVQGAGSIPDKFGKNDTQARPALVQMIRDSLQPLPVDQLFTPAEIATPETLIFAMEKRLMQSTLPPSRRRVLQAFLASKKSLDAEAVRGAVRLLMDTPDYQIT